MKSYGIRQAKAHLSQIAREAAAGHCSLITDNRMPVAMIGPGPAESIEAKAAPPAMETKKALSDAAAFRKALFGAPHALELDF